MAEIKPEILPIQKLIQQKFSKSLEKFRIFLKWKNM